jgi:hypothetical protein
VLSIDRVDIETEILPGPVAVGAPPGPEPTGGSLLAAREQFRAAVLEVLREHLRELDRSGIA